MNEIEIKYNPNADTRTMTSLPTEKELFKINQDHITDVQKCLQVISNNLNEKALTHDLDKLYDVEGFLRDMKDTWENKKDFTSLPWYKNHKNEEHHRVDLDENYDKVTIEDILENTVDKLTATAARRNHLTDKDIYEIADSIDSGTLKLGLINTLLNIKERIRIIGEDGR